MNSTLHLNWPPESNHLTWRKRLLREAIIIQYGSISAYAAALGCSEQLINGTISGWGRTSRPMQDRLAALSGVPVEALFPKRAAKAA